MRHGSRFCCIFQLICLQFMLDQPYSISLLKGLRIQKKALLVSFSMTVSERWLFLLLCVPSWLLYRYPFPSPVFSNQYGWSKVTWYGKRSTSSRRTSSRHRYFLITDEVQLRFLLWVHSTFQWSAWSWSNLDLYYYKRKILLSDIPSIRGFKTASRLGNPVSFL